MGLTQKQLAGLLGVTYQQIHKYETGMNRISVGRLHDFSQALNVGVGWFFDGMVLSTSASDQPPYRRTMLDFMRSVVAIKYPEHLQALNIMVRALSGLS